MKNMLAFMFASAMAYSSAGFAHQVDEAPEEPMVTPSAAEEIIAPADGNLTEEDKHAWDSFLGSLNRIIDSLREAPEWAEAMISTEDEEQSVEEEIIQPETSEEVSGVVSK